jgi:hypothetical protein
VSRVERLCHLQIVDFDLAWLVLRFAQLPPETVDLPLRRIEMMMRAHRHRSIGPGFVTTMWPTEGPVDGVIGRICRLANEDYGSTRTPNPVADESFGFCKSPAWRVKLNLMTDHSEYQVPRTLLFLVKVNIPPAFVSARRRFFYLWYCLYSF